MKIYSVTEVLGPWSDFSGIRPEILELAADRGRRVHAHAAAKLTDAFLIDEPRPEDQGFITSLNRWIDENVVQVIAVEEEFIDRDLGYAAHPDLIAKIRNHQMPCVVDWKTPASASPVWQVQLAGYCMVAKKHYGCEFQGMTVRPRSDGGTANAIVYKNNGIDFSIFMSALNVYRYFNPNPRRNDYD